jgi:tetratricopeptide (TPR) repeat protein
MTATPHSPGTACARERLRGRLLFRSALAIAATVQMLILIAPPFSGRALAEERTKGEIKVSTDGGYARLAFRFDKEMPATIQVTYPIMVVSFKKPVAISVDRLNIIASSYISAARLDPDGMSIRIALAQKVKFDSIPAAERLYVDLLPETWSETLPGLPREVIDELAKRALEAERQLRLQRVSAKTEKPAAIRVKVATEPTFTRYVFAMPDLANVVPENADGKLTLEFDQPIKWDLSDATVALPPALKSIDADLDEDSVAVTFTFNGDPQVRTFREDRSIVVDVSADRAKPKAVEQGAKPKQAAATPAAVPGIASPETVPVKDAEAAPPPDKPAAAAAAAPSAPPAPPPPKDAALPAAAPAPAAPATPAPKLAAIAVPPPPEKPAVAEHKRPAADPNGPVVVELRQSGDTLRAEFPFAVATPAAVFQRADTLWLVFDSAAKIDLTAVTNDSSRVIRSAALEHGADGEAIVRVKLKRPRLVSLEADSPGWILTMGDSVTAPSRPLAIARNIVGKNRASISIPFEHPGKIHSLIDLDIGDRLLVVTALGPARGFLKAQNFVELRALPSTHGVVLQPLADDITAELAVDKITVTRPGGLSLSPTAADAQPTNTFHAVTFDTQLWTYNRQTKYNARQAELMQIAAMAPQSQRKQARLSLARFYLASGMSAEAKAVLDVEQADAKGDDDITGSVLESVASLMLERPEDALKTLTKPRIGNQLDAPIWRAIAYTDLGQWPEAQAAFKNVDNAISALPIELQRMALRKALRTAIEVRDFNGADHILNELTTLGVPPEREPSVAVLVGRLKETLGRTSDALASYHAAAASNDRRAAAQGRLREILLRYAVGEMPRKDAIDALEMLTTIWRGDETEAEGLKLLAHLYTEENYYRAAFHVMRVALMVHPNSDFTRQIQDEARVIFDGLFLGGQADVLPPIEALGLFYDYRDLTPVGWRGDEMIRKLADRLVSVDLLDQAAELLQHQVDHRLQGGARAQVATRLAVIYLMNRKPDRAIATLQTTRTAELSTDLRDQRLLLEARAMSETGRHDLALELIANIDTREATRLRSDILWAARRWRPAAEQIEVLYGERWRDFTPLNETERFDILRAAIGYSLGDEPLGLARFRERYAPKMAGTPDGRAFDVVSAPVGTSGAEFQSIAKKVAGVDSLEVFLRDMRTRYPDSSAISRDAAPPAVTAAPAAAAAAPPPKAPKADRTPTGSISRR